MMKRQHRISLAMTTVGAVIALGAMSVSIGSVAAGDGKPNTDHKVTICHRTNSVTNPYRSESVAKSSVDGSVQNNESVHEGDNESDHSHHNGATFNVYVDYPTPHNGDQWGDIIPPFYDDGTAGDWTAKNWDAAGQAIFNNDCDPVIMLCHATDSTDKPYDLVTVGLKGHEDSFALSAQSDGLSAHLRHEGDIIPAFGDFDGLNWDTRGQAIWNNGCVIPFTSVKLCHATKSVTVPYELVEVKVAYLFGDDELTIGGHELDTGSLWTKTMTSGWGDIIPSFDYKKDGVKATYPGYNYTDAGKAIFDNKCLIPTTPTTSTTPTSVAQQGPQVGDVSGSLPTTGSDQTQLLVLGSLMALGGLLATMLVRRQRHA